MQKDDDDDGDDDVVVEDAGDYEMIAPAPHNKPSVSRKREVPPYIVRPAYASTTGESHVEAPNDDGLVALGSEDENRLRTAAALAARILKSVGDRVTTEVSSLVYARGNAELR